MCNLYSMTKGQQAIRDLARAMRDTTGNLPPLPGIFPDYPAPIVRNATDGIRELAMVRWGMPSSKRAIFEAAKTRAGKLEAKGKEVDFEELLRMEPDGGTTNVRNTASSHWKPWLGAANRCVVPQRAGHPHKPWTNSMTPPDDKHIDQTRRMLATIGHRAHATDPLGALVGMLPEDPMVANFLVLRQTPPDLREAAFRAAAHAAEAFKMIGFEHLKEIEGGYDAVAGLKILAAAHEAEVAIWPCDFDVHAVAKVSLHPCPSHQSSLRRDGFARDLRVILAALNPGFQRLPPDRRPPTLDQRAFEPRPRWMFDLESELSALPQEASFGLSNHKILAKLARTEPNLTAFADRADKCFTASDALFVESMRAGPDMLDLRMASEGARIAAYALCAQVGIWPARKGTADRDAKSRVQALVNARAKTQDPLHMIAAVRLAFIRSEQPHMFTPARWDERPLDTPWVENV